MSPPLLDTQPPPPPPPPLPPPPPPPPNLNPNPKFNGQIPLSPSLNLSNPQFQFKQFSMNNNNPSNPNPTSFSSRSSGLTKPKFVKVRKQAQNFKSTPVFYDNSDFFNPFRSVSGVENSVNTGSFIAEELKNLRIGRDGNFRNDETFKLQENISKLNIEGEQNEGTDFKRNFRFRSDSADNVSGFGVPKGEEESLRRLPDELKGKMNVNEGTNEFVFKASGSKKGAGLFNESSASAHSVNDRFRNLNIKDNVNRDCSNNSDNNNKNDDKGNEKGGFACSTGCKSGEMDESLLLNELEKKLNIGHENVGGFATGKQTENSGETGFAKEGSIVFTFHTGMQGKDSHTRSQVPSDKLKNDHQPAGNVFGLPTMDSSGSLRKQETVGTSNIEFETPNMKGNLFSALNQKVEFAAKRNSVRDTKEKKKKGKLKQPVPVKLWPAQDFIFLGGSEVGDNTETIEASESYSPMDISPYQEAVGDIRHLRETSVASDRSFSFDNNHEVTESPPTVSNSAIDEDLIDATARMEINGDDVKSSETKNEGVGAEGPAEDSVSGAETESFKSANEEIDINSVTTATSVENEASSSSNLERQCSDGRMQFGSYSNLEDIGGANFIFAASSAPQSPVTASKRHQRKKNLAKIVHDSHNLTPNTKVPYASSSVQFPPLSPVSSLLSPGRGKKADIPLSQGKCGDNSELAKENEVRKGFDSTSVAAVAAQEACEKWRLRGNHAYMNGDLSKAEDCYTQGVNCISKSEASKDCLRALMLCYSNRAATRMSLGRMRDALADCMMAAATDPGFVKAQVRAGNCYLALGEVEDAVLYFKKCLQSGDDVCVDRKIAVEASDGLQKAQKVSECIQHSSELVRRRTPDDVKSALDVIAEALLISSYAEILLEMKAEALLLLGKYEETIQLSEQTFDSAERNAPLLVAAGQLPNQDDSGSAKEQYFRLWRCRLIFKSYFCLGRLGEAIAFLEKQEGLWSVSMRCESMTLESAVPCAAIALQLLHHKNAGNEAFQAGRHTEAVDHYTAALSCNVESRPFAAICFCNRAAAYKAVGQITDAIADCSLAIALDGNYLKALSRRSTLYEMIRDYGQAANDLQKFIDLLTKQVEEKTNTSGVFDRSSKYANDLRQARLRLSEIEGEARKEIPLDAYLILGVEPSVSASEIKKAYRKAALRHHPDKAGQLLARNENGDDGRWKEIGEEVHKDADRLFKMIGEAYAVLSDPTKRARYDFEEEMRNAQKKRNGGSTSRTHADMQNYPYERSGVRRYWRDI